eukprot:TRINITY_DN60798_c0_g1_i1.p1 TRINITY_DN60798_c0_g1~~TRINITY_DN60798_c0_g1_i1.p1  ORF type:complete len:340 (+),score=22.26 TRINITY_DN60798_c0_g1_i1:70-1020(+)
MAELRDASERFQSSQGIFSSQNTQSQSQFSQLTVSSGASTHISQAESDMHHSATVRMNGLTRPPPPTTGLQQAAVETLLVSLSKTVNSISNRLEKLETELASSSATVTNEVQALRREVKKRDDQAAQRETQHEEWADELANRQQTLMREIQSDLKSHSSKVIHNVTTCVSKHAEKLEEVLDSQHKEHQESQANQHMQLQRLHATASQSQRTQPYYDRSSRQSPNYRSSQRPRKKQRSGTPPHVSFCDTQCDSPGALPLSPDVPSQLVTMNNSRRIPFFPAKPPKWTRKRVTEIFQVGGDGDSDVEELFTAEAFLMA